MYQENRCIAMTGNIEQFENSQGRKFFKAKRTSDKYYKLFAPKDSIRKKDFELSEVKQC